MTVAPINVFSHSLDLPGVVAALLAVAHEVQTDGPDHAWTELIVLGPPDESPRPRLRITYDPDYFDEPNGQRQRLGMVGYFSRFPETPKTAEALQAIRSFRAIFAFPDNDLDLFGDDPRLEWLATLASHLEGVIFTPGSLLAANGRTILNAAGDFDPEAVVPTYPAIESAEAEDEDDANGDDEEDDDFDDDDDDEDIPPPGARRVAERVFVLACLANRGLLEQESDDADEANETFEAMVDWLKELEAFDEAEPDECEVLQRRAGKLHPQEKVNAVWRVEGLAVLMWALGLTDLPRYDELVTPNELFEALNFFEPEAQQIIARSELRPTEELEAYRIQALMTHWRLREFSLRPEAMDFLAFSKNSWIGEFDTSSFTLVDNDLALQGEPIAEADPDLVSTCSSVARERHLAINWLLGGSLVYSKTDTST